MSEVFKIAISKAAIASIGNKPNPALFTTTFENVELNLNELSEIINAGYSYTAQHSNNRRNIDNFVAANWIAVDYDHAKSLEAITSTHYYKNNASLIYSTPSHTPEAPRYRVIFQLDKTISDAEKYSNLKFGFYEILGGKDAGIDLSCKDASKFFYGCKESEPQTFNNRPLTVDMVNCIYSSRNEPVFLFNKDDLNTPGGYAKIRAKREAFDARLSKPTKPAKTVSKTGSKAPVKAVEPSKRAIEPVSQDMLDKAGIEANGFIKNLNKLAWDDYSSWLNMAVVAHTLDNSFGNDDPNYFYDLYCEASRNHPKYSLKDENKLENEFRYLKGYQSAYAGLDIQYDPTTKQAIDPRANELEAIEASEPIEAEEFKKVLAKIETIKANQADQLVELGNSVRFIKQWSGKVKYCEPIGGWFIWSGKQWKLDELGKISELAKKTVLSIYDEVAALGKKGASKKELDALIRHVKVSQTEKGITATYRLSKTNPSIAVLPKVFDTDLMLFNCKNGTFDLEIMQFNAHNPADMITKIANFEYDANAKCPTWLAFLDKIFAGNQELINYIQTALGYTMTGSTKHHALFFCYGLGSNGKSTFLNTIDNLLGDYSCKLSFTSLLVKDKGHNGTASPDIARLPGARYVFASEPNAGTSFDEASLKEMTGGEPITTRQIFREQFTFKPAFKLWLAGNSKPNIKGQDLGIWRRIKLIPFEVTIADSEKDYDLESKLVKELPGILNWFIEGCLKWQTNGLVEPEIVKIATEQYKNDSDVLRDFVNDCLVKSEYSTRNTAIYKAYVTYCELNDDRSMSKKAFYSSLSERGFKAGVAAGNQTVFKNVSLVRDKLTLVYQESEIA